MIGNEHEADQQIEHHEVKKEEKDRRSKNICFLKKMFAVLLCSILVGGLVLFLHGSVTSVTEFGLFFDFIYYVI